MTGRVKHPIAWCLAHPDSPATNLNVVDCLNLGCHDNLLKTHGQRRHSTLLVPLLPLGRLLHIGPPSRWRYPHGTAGVREIRFTVRI